MSEPRTDLLLGRCPDGDVRLPNTALLRHVMALGASGSGKTVLCKVVVEEAVRAGIPVICVDPQGDLCSLALTDERGAELGDAADVVVFTPASRSGVALCADPLGAGAPGGDDAERMRARARAAGMVASLLGYDAGSDDGDGLRAVIDTALSELDARGAPARRLEDLTAHLADPGAEAQARYERLLDPRKLRAASRRLARLDVGARRLMFHYGTPLDIDALLGRGPQGGGVDGKTRVAVVYLNSLHGQDDKDFFVAALVDRLYGWMLANPSSRPQVLFYIDEISPFLPPVRKPACKPGLSLLFKQARKYGVACLMATQNPGDVDYKAMSQFGTWALGRLTTRQDVAKIAPTVKSLAPDVADELLASLPSRRPGEFALISPDHFDAPVSLATRWLHTVHETLDERRIAELADERWRHRFPEPGDPSASESGAAAAPSAVTDAPAAKPTDAEPGPAAARPDPDPVRQPDSQSGGRVAGSAGGDRPDGDPAVGDRPVGNPAVGDRPGKPEDERDRMARALGERRTMTAREFADRIGCGETKARRLLRELVAHGLARHFKERRTTRYWATHTGARPDLGLGDTVAVVCAELDREQIEERARAMQRSKLLGLLGEDEELETAQPIHRPVYQVEFDERIERSVLQRMFGASHEDLIGTTYHHPVSLAAVVYSPRRGITFVDEPGALASQIEDFDGFARFADVAPGTLEIDDEAWQKRRSPGDVEKHFRARFDAVPRRIATVFVPLWRVLFRQRERGNYRVVTLDGLVGKPVEWP